MNKQTSNEEKNQSEKKKNYMLTLVGIVILDEHNLFSRRNGKKCEQVNFSILPLAFDYRFSLGTHNNFKKDNKP